MKRPLILSATIAALVSASLTSEAATDTISGANPAWATTTNWSLGAIPTATDNAVIAATGTVDIRGSGFVGNITEIQDLTFSTAAAVTLVNNSTSQNMTLVLNGGRGAAVPLLSTTGNFTYTITGTGTGTHTLTLQLKAGGIVDIAGTGRLDNTASMVESGGSFGLTKTGTGILNLSAVNSFTGGVVVNAGTLELSNSQGAGSGGIVANAGTRLALRNLTINNAVTLAGAELATRTGDLSTLAGPVNITANSTAVLRSYTTPANDQSITIGGKLSGSSNLTITGNASNATSGKAFILTNPTNDFSGTFTVTAGQRLRTAPAGPGNPLATATVDLTGGTLQLREDGTGSNTTIAYNNNLIVGTGGGSIDVDHLASINTDNALQLGTLNIGADTLSTVGGSNYAVRFAGQTTLTGNAGFNTVSAPLRFDGAITGGFGISKDGAGVLTLAGANTYNGVTNVNGGTLTLTGSVANTSQINVAAGATFDVASVPGGFVLGSTQTISGSGTVNGPVTVANNGTIMAPGEAAGTAALTFSQLTLGEAPGNVANVNIGINTIPGSVVVTMPNGLTLTGGTGNAKLNVSSPSLAIGTYVLVDYDGVIGGAGFAGFAIGSLPARTIATLVNNTVNTSVDLSVTGVDFPIWTGLVSSQWSTATIANPKNWKENNSGNNTDFLNGDHVVFNDTAARGTVDVSVSDVSVTNITFDHSAINYSVTGSKAIIGTGGLLKLGSAKLTIGNINRFTGPVTINGGAISIAAVADSGLDSPLGAGSAISIDGGALQFTGVAGSTNRPVTIGTNGATIQTDGDLVLAGNLTGLGNLTKTGTGKMTLTGTGNAHANTTISAGILQVGDGTANAGAPGTGTITNEAELIFDHSNNFTITNTIEGSGKLTKRGTGTLVLGGSFPNSYTGGTTISAGTLTAGKPAGLDAITGDLTIEAGGTFRYLTDNTSNQIADTASVTLNGGTFGDPTNVGPTNPGATDTITNLTINSGTFGSGRNATLGSFTITGLLKVSGGVALSQRGGGIAATMVEVSGGTVNLDGGSTTAGQESHLNVGTNGLKLIGGTVNFNAGPSPMTATSQGSILSLSGDVTSTGTSKFVRVNTAELAPKARIDLGGLDRTFDVTGTLEVGAPGASVEITNGGVIKTGSGSLILGGDNTYVGQTKIDAGSVVVKGTLAGSTPIEVGTGATFDVSGAAGGFTLFASQTLKGTGTILGDVIANGTIAPGNSIGKLHFGGSLTLTGISSFEIDKTGISLTADLAEVVAALFYGGILDVTATGDPLAMGDTFNLFDASSFNGGFSTLNLPALEPGLFWDTTGLLLNGTITVVPEPGSCASLVMACGLAAGFKRRRRR